MSAAISVWREGAILSVSLAIVGVVLLPGYPPAAGQEVSLGDGVYTERQAGRGARVYRTTCESCHAVNLEGSEQGPTLLGDEFLEGWDGEVLAELMILMMDTMPGDNPGGLTEEEFTDVLSYLLRENGYPPGDELTTDMLEEIVIDLHVE